jgi:hypothetical protein
MCVEQNTLISYLLETAVIRAGVGEPRLASYCGGPAGTFCMVGTSWGGTTTSALAFPMTNVAGSHSSLGTVGSGATRKGNRAHSLTEPGCLTSILHSGVGKVLRTSG